MQINTQVLILVSLFQGNAETQQSSIEAPMVGVWWNTTITLETKLDFTSYCTVQNNMNAQAMNFQVKVTSPADPWNRRPVECHHNEQHAQQDWFL